MQEVILRSSGTLMLRGPTELSDLPGDRRYALASIKRVSTVLGGVVGGTKSTLTKVWLGLCINPCITAAEPYSVHCLGVILAGEVWHPNVPSGWDGLSTQLRLRMPSTQDKVVVVNGYAGPDLLYSSGEELRPVVLACVEQSRTHLGVYLDGSHLIAEENAYDGRIHHGKSYGVPSKGWKEYRDRKRTVRDCRLSIVNSPRPLYCI
ncbi:hypothetical protein BJX76DRAFT_338346, partial [Aspergillus varians]